MTFARPAWALALSLLASLSGCFVDDCTRCGRCEEGTISTAAADVDPGLGLPAVTVWDEPDGEIVVEVSHARYVTCEQTRTESLFFRWNPSVNALERRAAGPSAQARRLTPTTLGGGVRSYEDLAPGFTLQVAELFAEARTEITTRYQGSLVRMTCRGSGNAPLVCQ